MPCRPRCLEVASLKLEARSVGALRISCGAFHIARPEYEHKFVAGVHEFVRYSGMCIMAYMVVRLVSIMDVCRVMCM